MSEARSGSDGGAELAALVRTLHETQRRIAALTAGGVDAAMLPAGEPDVLAQAQASMRAREADQRPAAERSIAILNALPASIALLDERGHIVEVNAAWREFAAANAFPSASAGVGCDYLAVCDRAAAAGIADAESAARGIRAVLSGLTTQFRLEYPCHSDTEQRWFRLLVTPLTVPVGQRAAVVMHVNVTERHLAEGALRASEAHLRAILDGEPECVKVVSIDGLVLEMNPAGLRMVEAEHASQVIGRPISAFVHPEDRGAFLRLHRRACLGESGRLEFRLVGLRGTERWMETHAASLREGRGRVTSVLSVTRDVSERKRAEEILRHRESLLRIAGKVARIGGWAMELPQRELDLSEEIRVLLGFAPDAELSPQQRLALCMPESRRRFVKALAHCLRHGTPIDLEVRMYNAAGQTIDAHVRGEAQRAPSGVITRVQGALQDISERKRLHAKLEQSEERFRYVARATVDAVWDWDLVTDAISWGGAMEALFGYRADEIEHDPRVWETYVHPDDRGRVLASLRAATDAGATQWEHKFRFRRKDGSFAMVVSRGFILRDEHGKPTRIVGGMTDITERLALEDQLRQSQRLEAVGQLTGGMAHDFNNLLTVILGNAELLAERLREDPSAGTLARMIGDAAQRGAELTQRLLAFARRQPLAPVPVDVNALAGDMGPMLRRTLGEHIDVEVRRGSDVAPAQADPAQLESALLNLCLNARDAMPDGGKLTIETANIDVDPASAPCHVGVVPGRYVMIAVADTGCGIPPQLIDRVFEPFFTTKEKAKGTGLGLSMVYGFVKQSGGHVTIQSAPAAGTTVRMYFPRASAGVVSSEHELAQPRVISGGEVILLVEDDALVRRYVHEQILTLGYRVWVAEDGPRALALLRRGEPVDLLFTDVVMPGGMNGRELARVARELRPNLRVLFTSGYTENAIVQDGRIEPGTLLLTKPYRREELARRIREALDAVPDRPEHSRRTPS